MVSPFGGIIPSYEAAQRLQMERQNQQAAADAQDAAQEAQKQATEYQQGQDAQRQQNWQATFDAGQKQQDIENQVAQAKMDMEKGFHQQTADYHNQLIQNAITKMGQATDKATADRLQKHYQFLLGQGMSPVDAYTQALVAMHLPGNENGPGQPGLGQSGMSILGTPPTPTAQPQVSAPSVLPPAAPSGLGGVSNPLQTPQIVAPTAGEQQYNTLDRMGQIIRGEVPSALSSSPLPGVAAKIGLQQAQTQRTTEQAETERLMRDPKIQDLLSKTKDRDFLAKEKADNDKIRNDIARSRADAQNAFAAANTAYKQAQMQNNTLGSAWRDPKVTGALNRASNTYRALIAQQSNLSGRMGKIKTQIAGISSVLNSVRPSNQNPQGQAQWDELNAIGPNGRKAGQSMIDAWNDELDDLSRNYNAAEEEASQQKMFLDAARQEIDRTGAAQKGGGYTNPPAPTNRSVMGDMTFGLTSPTKPGAKGLPKITPRPKSDNSIIVNGKKITITKD